MTPSPAFQCRFQNTLAAEEQIFPFEPDPVKKNSAFWLVIPAHENSAKCSIDIQGDQQEATLTIESTQDFFVLGGFQLESNSKMIQVYLQKDAGAEKEYLTTCRGIGDTCKATCAIPGGPRQVTRLFLGLKSLQPMSDEEYNVRIKSLKLTARIPEIFPGETISTTVPDAPAQHQQSAPISPGVSYSSPSILPSLSQDEVSSAMAAVSMMMRATENRIVHAITQQLSQQQARHEHEAQQLNRLVSEQRVFLQQQSQLLMMQTSSLQQQAAQIAELKKGQADILHGMSGRSTPGGQSSSPVCGALSADSDYSCDNREQGVMPIDDVGCEEIVVTSLDGDADIPMESLTLKDKREITPSLQTELFCTADRAVILATQNLVNDESRSSLPSG